MVAERWPRSLFSVGLPATPNAHAGSPTLKSNLSLIEASGTVKPTLFSLLSRKLAASGAPKPNLVRKQEKSARLAARYVCTILASTAFNANARAPASR